ncbi:MAG TPA: DUF2231 domain-containing protein [bacterium]|nr:DUF2231 domain-containing protein [bacterium]
MPLHFNWRLELHPVLVHFPIALLCLAFIFDAIGWIRKAQSFRLAGLYCLVAGAIGTALSVASGLVTPDAREREGGLYREGGRSLLSFFSGRRVQVHEHWGYVLLALVLLWLVLRWLIHLDASRSPRGVMGIGVLVLIVLFITGYLGGELTYGRRDRGGTVRRDIGRSGPPIRVGPEPRALEATPGRGEGGP